MNQPKGSQFQEMFCNWFSISKVKNWTITPQKTFEIITKSGKIYILKVNQKTPSDIPWNKSRIDWTSNQEAVAKQSNGMEWNMLFRNQFRYIWKFVLENIKKSFLCKYLFLFELWYHFLLAFLLHLLWRD